MSKKVRANIRCPKCNHEAPSELYRSIWVEEPQNRALILSDAINAVTCPKCKLRQRLEFPFLATNLAVRLKGRLDARFFVGPENGSLAVNCFDEIAAGRQVAEFWREILAVPVHKSRTPSHT